MNIHQSLKLLTTGALALAVGDPLRAETAAPFPGYINEHLRTQNPAAKAWNIGGDDQLRAESRQGMAVAGQAGSVDFRNSGADVTNDYLVNRLRFHVGYSAPWWNLYVEGRSSTALGDDRYAYANSPAIPGTVRRDGDGPDSNTIDLHQAHLSLGNLKEFPLSLKIGRQELSYGEERLVGAFVWNNIGRVFDAAKVRFQNDWVGADFFASHVVIPEDRHFDGHNSEEGFSGMYASSGKIPKHTVDVYFLARNASRSAIAEAASPQFAQPTARDIYTVGGRLQSKPGEVGSFDYLLDGAYQFGRFAPSMTAAAQRQDAFMFVAKGGYTLTNLWGKPRLGAEYAFGSGDNDPADGRHGTFENLFPTNHKFYGYMDFFSLENLHDVRAILQVKPNSRSSVLIEGHGFWLADRRDYLYSITGAPRTAAGYGINPGYSGFVGTELDIVGSYSLARSAQLEAGYGHFFTGDYVESSLAGVGGDRDANWFYAQLTLKF